MTIFLPQEPANFHKAFDKACNRILKSKYDEVFYELLVQLIEKIRELPFFKETFNEFEAEVFKRQLDFSQLSLNCHEYHWKKLWQYHRHDYKHRRQLVQIKRIITHPRRSLSSPLHARLNFAMRGILSLFSFPSLC